MNLINFIVWLCAGAVMGWIARWMVEVEHRRTHQSLNGEDEEDRSLSDEKS
jgi:hypothetical protein